MRRIRKTATSAISNELLSHLREAIKDKSYFDLAMAANLIKNNEQTIRNTFGWNPSAIIGLYADVTGYYQQNGYDENNSELPDWCIGTLKHLVD